jgi:hypothetical protein
MTECPHVLDIDLEKVTSELKSLITASNINRLVLVQSPGSQTDYNWICIDVMADYEDRLCQEA